jgi:hypothetical protein
MSYFTCVAFLKVKFDALNQLKIYKALVENMTQKTIKISRSGKVVNIHQQSLSNFLKKTGFYINILPLTHPNKME